MRGAGRRALEPGTPPAPPARAAGCRFVSPSLARLVCGAGTRLRVQAAVSVRREVLKHRLPQEVLVIVEGSFSGAGPVRPPELCYVFVPHDKPVR